MAGHLGSFGRALAASTRRRRFGAEGAFDQLANCLRAAGPVGLLFGGILRKPCCSTPTLPLANNAKYLCQVFYFLWANLPASFHHEVFGLRARCDGLKLSIQIFEPTALYHPIHPTHLAAVQTYVRIFIHLEPLRWSAHSEQSKGG
jgi:hypothetical protein